MKNKRLGGGLLVGAVVLGVLIGQFLNFKGPGTGETSNETGGPAQSASQEKTAEEQAAEARAALAETNAVVKPEPGASSGNSEPLITVVVFQDKYRITREDNVETGLEMPLAQVVARAQATTGTADGIRVRILLHETAQGGAHSDLLEALREAGFRSEEIQERSGYLQ